MKRYKFAIDNVLVTLLRRVPLMVRRSVSQSDNSSSILLRATEFFWHKRIRMLFIRTFVAVNTKNTIIGSA